MKIPMLFCVFALGLVAAPPLSAQDGRDVDQPAAAETSDTEAEAGTADPVADAVADPGAAPATAPAAATQVDPAAAAAAQPSRPLPKMRQGTPYMGDRKRVILVATLFFLLSSFMAMVLLRSKEDVPA